MHAGFTAGTDLPETHKCTAECTNCTNNQPGSKNALSHKHTLAYSVSSRQPVESKSAIDGS